TQPSEQLQTKSSKKSVTTEEAAQESSDTSGYPKTQPSEQSATQKSKTTQKNSKTSGYPTTQLSKQQKTQSSKKSTSKKSKPAQDSSETSGYPAIQPSEQQATQSSENLAFKETAQDSSETSGYPEIQPLEQQATQLSETTQSSETSGYPAVQPSEQLQTQQPTAAAKKTSDKLAKRENPDYTQTTFRIPKKLSRQINRTLMDLADEGIEMDRSDLLETLSWGFIRLVNEVGAVEALEQFKNLGTQVDE
ncbi:MAG: hypothetical protein AAFY21_03480, partial [Cyanobacteria bacterium J06641_2]